MMRYFFFPIILGLIAIASLNFYVDATNRWWRTEFGFSNQWRKDQCWVTPLRMDYRQPRIKHISMLPRISLLALGSSRVYNLESDMLAVDNNFYNASVAGATVWDYVAIWEKFKYQNNIPEYLIIYLDTWNFNKNTWQKYRWISALPLVMNFLYSYDVDHKLKISAMGEWLSGSFYEFSDLFSPAALKISFQEFNIHRRAGSVKTNFISDTTTRPLDFPAWQSDGSHLYPAEDTATKSLEEITRIGRNTGLGAMYVYLKDWETDDNAVKLLDYLLTDTEKHNVEVLLVQPPFQHETYKILRENREYKDIPNHYEAIVNSLLKLHKNTSYCNVINPAIVACEPREFMDSSHTLRSCAKKIIDYCLNKVPKRKWQ